jgi:hypothetical protein
LPYCPVKCPTISLKKSLKRLTSYDFFRHFISFHFTSLHFTSPFQFSVLKNLKNTYSILLYHFREIRRCRRTTVITGVGIPKLITKQPKKLRKLCRICEEMIEALNGKPVVIGSPYIMTQIPTLFI